MRKLALISLSLCFVGLPAFGRAPDPLQKNVEEVNPINDGSSQAERKLLNGDGYNKPAPLPVESGESDYKRCKSEDCESDE